MICLSVIYIYRMPLLFLFRSSSSMSSYTLISGSTIKYTSSSPFIVFNPLKTCLWTSLHHSWIVGENFHLVNPFPPSLVFPVSRTLQTPYKLLIDPLVIQTFLNRFIPSILYFDPTAHPLSLSLVNPGTYKKEFLKPKMSYSLLRYLLHP